MKDDKIINEITAKYSTEFDSSDFINILRVAVGEACKEKNKLFHRATSFGPIIEQLDNVINNLEMLRDASKALDSSIIELYSIVNQFKFDLNDE